MQRDEAVAINRGAIMKKSAVLVMLMLAVLLSACSKKQPETPPKGAVRVGLDSIKARMLEQDTFNIPYWLEHGANGRILVRLSSLPGIKPVSESGLASVKEAARSRNFKALTEMGGAGVAKDSTIFTAENTAYVAHELGIVDEVYWVVPTFESITQPDLDRFKDFLKKDLPGQESEIDALTLKDKVAEGKINGIPIKIMAILDVPPIDKPVLLNIECSYFSALYKNEKETRILGFVSGFFVALKDRKLTAELVSISPSNVGGFVPVRFRYLALYVWTLLNKPTLLDGQPPADWSERADAWKVEERSPREALPIYKNLVKTYPQDTASLYDLSGVYFKLGDMENCRKALAEAAKIDPVYNLGYVEYATRLTQAGKKAEAERFVAALGRK